MTNVVSKIVSTQFNLRNRALEIYFSGCKRNCYGCHNPELQDFNKGIDYYKWLKQINLKLVEFDSIIDNVWILGGEPLDNDYWNIFEVILHIPKDKQIWLFTGYDFEEVPLIFKIWCNYIKCGAYIEELKTSDNIQYGIKLATSNQKIYKKGKDY